MRDPSPFACALSTREEESSAIQELTSEIYYRSEREKDTHTLSPPTPRSYLFCNSRGSAHHR